MGPPVEGSGSSPVLGTSVSVIDGRLDGTVACACELKEEPGLGRLPWVSRCFVGSRFNFTLVDMLKQKLRCGPEYEWWREIPNSW
jgi:hypothetical protein